MSTGFAIRASGIGKRYQLGASRAQAPKGVVDRFSRLLNRRRGGTPFWALKDVSFDVRHGENIGLIGMNGAGKSTLLKILSRITRPTTGRIVVDGRIGALLEVGTGFHGDLTGRENVFLYGSVLGMRQEEIRRKFDAIVDFSGTGQFIDTPVKRYSSGMYVRLAFAVAAHLEPEILLLDEVLAVGDLPFQRKCMEFVKEIQRREASIIFVSHNMFSIKTMCSRVVYLRKGEVVFDGDIDAGIKLYEDDSRILPKDETDTRGPIRITGCEILDADGQERQVFKFGERMRVRITYETNREIDAPNFIVVVIRSDEVRCCNFSSEDDGVQLGTVKGKGVLELLTPPIKLVADLYNLGVLVRERGFQELLTGFGPVSFHVSHDLYDINFGVFHEHGQWTVGGAGASLPG